MARTASADGGNGPNEADDEDPGGAGGGRIAVYFRESELEDMTVSHATKGLSEGSSEDGENGTLVFIDVDDNTAWILTRMEFNASDTAHEGILKSSASDEFNFSMIHILSDTIRIDSNANITADTLNMSLVDKFICDSDEGTDYFGFKLNTPEKSIYPRSTAVFNVTNLFIKTDLEFSNCDLVNLYENLTNSFFFENRSITTNNALYLDNPTLEVLLNPVITTGHSLEINASSLGNLTNMTGSIGYDLIFSGLKDNCRMTDSKFTTTNRMLSMPITSLFLSNTELTSTANANASIMAFSDNLTLSNSNITASIKINATNLTIPSDSFISASECGYAGGGYRADGEGPGGGDLANTYSACGGSYGGVGARGTYNGAYYCVVKPTYGSALRPDNYGSGGAGGGTGYPGGDGGGLIQLEVLDTLFMDSPIEADGQAATGSDNPAAGGSGGGIYINATKITGSGWFSADGGTSPNDGDNEDPGGSGGGRIAVYFKEINESVMPLSSVKNGEGLGASEEGQNGTLIFVDVDGEIAWIKDGFEFNSTDSSPVGNVKPTIDANFSFINVSTIAPSLIRFNGETVVNASIINFTSSTINASFTRIFLRYSEDFIDSGSTYSDGFYLSLERANQTRVDFIDSLSGIADISANTNVSNNWVFVNSTGESGLNVSANISVYNLSYSNFGIEVSWYDNETFITCPASVCTSLSYEDGTAFFNVSHFTVYKTVQGAVDYPVINLSAPSNNSAAGYPNITFIYNVNDTSENIAQCDLIINGEINQSNQPITEDINQSFSVWLMPGNYNWSINCTDDSALSLEGSSETRNLSVIAELFISETLTPAQLAADETFTVSGYVNFTNGTRVGDLYMGIYRNGTIICEDDWWNCSWKYRHGFNVSENAGYELTNYSLNVTIDTESLISAGKMQDDCEDLRFTNASGTELGHWINWETCNTPATNIWVKASVINADSNNTFYYYYGNTDVSNESNASKAMLWYDNFTSDTTSSYTEVGTWSWNSGGYVVDPSGNSEAAMLIPGITDTNLVVEVRGRSNDNDGTGSMVRADGVTTYYTCTTDPQNNRCGIGEDSGRDNLLVSTAQTQGSTTWIRTTLWVNGSTLNCTCDTGSSVVSVSTTDTSLTSGNPGLLSFYNDGSGHVDYITVRKYIYPEPSISLYSTGENRFSTNSSGFYNYTFTAPAIDEEYNITVNTTYEGYYAQKSSILTVASNTAPYKPSPSLNITNVYNSTWVNLSVIYSDANLDNGTVYLNLSVNGSFVASYSATNVSNGSSVSWIVDPNNWTKSDNLSFWAQSYDDTEFSGWSTTNKTVKDTDPATYT
jgi:hypothetical protein